MAISIQIKRGSLDKINAASLKAAELALETGSNTLYTGIDGQAGTAVPVRAGSAATATTATKLSAGKDFSISGDVTATAVSFDGSANVELKATIPAASIDTDKLAAGVVTSLGKADSAVQSVVTGTANGFISVDGADVAVKGLGSAAFTDASAYDAKGDAEAVKGTAADLKTAVTVYGARALAQQGIDDAASALAEAQAKVASVTAADKSVVITAGTTPTVKANISTTAGNALSLDDKGLFVATPAEYTAGTSISIDNHVISLSDIDCGELV